MDESIVIAVLVLVLIVPELLKLAEGTFTEYLECKWQSMDRVFTDPGDAFLYFGAMLTMAGVMLYCGYLHAFTMVVYYYSADMALKLGLTIYYHNRNTVAG